MAPEPWRRLQRLKRARNSCAWPPRAERRRCTGWCCRRCARGDEGPARLGFTVTKKVGNAVVRNRTRRRLREAARQALRGGAGGGVDLVLIGRDATRGREFALLVDDLRRALDKAGAAVNPGPGCAGRCAVRAYQWTSAPADGGLLPLRAGLQRICVEAIRSHGALRGGALAGWRVLRCNPWNEGGPDPVPPRHPEGKA